MFSTPETLEKFVLFCQDNITGKEKQEAQIFLDRFFRAFGHEGALEAGAIYEKRIKKGSKKGNTGFADLVWKPRVLIEMKSRGEDLNKHYPQAFEYWTRLVPDRPRYVILCNFDEFWIYDFNQQLDEPMDIVPLEQLVVRSRAFGFMELRQQSSVFRNNQVEVTEIVGRRMGELFRLLYARGERSGAFDRLTAQRFILQCVLAMFAEDRGLLPKDLFVACIQDCLQGESSDDVLGGLFREMNTQGITPAGRYQGTNYFNGGLFATIHAIALTGPELEILDVAARQDWSKIRPAIFGNIFEGTANKKERHARGIHFTSEADIMAIVRPTISSFWEEKIEAANTMKELDRLVIELRNYRVLDPACGSGNFLYVAYQELKRIEQLLLEKILSRRKSKTLQQQQQMGIITPLQFFGIDINPFAVELARVTLTIARKVAVDRLGLIESTLPLDTLDKNIICQDALFYKWPQADAIIGNPPFLGGKHMRLTLGDDYIDRIFSKFSDVQDSVDFCSYWFRLAHHCLGQKGRAGLVGTNSISQGKSRTASLDYITKNGGYIHNAISSQPWSGEAKVHVSLVNWITEKPTHYYLDRVAVSLINSGLQANIDVSQANKIKANKNYCFQGVSPVGKGFLIDKELSEKFKKDNLKNQEIIRLFSMGYNLAQNPHGLPDRFVIDFQDMTIEEASLYPSLFEHIKETVKPERDKNRMEKRRLYWWKFGVNALQMRKKLDRVNFCFAVPRVSKWAIFLKFSKDWLPGDKSVVVISEDFYVLGILLSQVHRTWMSAQKSTLKADIAYTTKTCFETFPFPQDISPQLVQNIRQTALDLHEYRSEQMECKQWGITQLYNTFFHESSSHLYQLHQQLDRLVMAAYEFTSEDDILEKILNLNHELAAKENNGKIVIGPWNPHTQKS
jgi:SAM-dependent methyltransferase